MMCDLSKNCFVICEKRRNDSWSVWILLILDKPNMFVMMMIEIIIKRLGMIWDWDSSLPPYNLFCLPGNSYWLVHVYCPVLKVFLGPHSTKQIIFYLILFSIFILHLTFFLEKEVFHMSIGVLKIITNNTGENFAVLLTLWNNLMGYCKNIFLK